MENAQTRRHVDTQTRKKTRGFEDLRIWQVGRELVMLVYEETSKWKDFGLKDQIRRAVVSIVSNIAEGYERGSKSDFIRFLYISRGSCGEVKAQLYVAKDLKYIETGRFETMLDKADHVARMLGKFISNNRKKGS